MNDLNDHLLSTLEKKTEQTFKHILLRIQYQSVQYYVNMKKCIVYNQTVQWCSKGYNHTWQTSTSHKWSCKLMRKSNIKGEPASVKCFRIKPRSQVPATSLLNYKWVYYCQYKQTKYKCVSANKVVVTQYIFRIFINKRVLGSFLNLKRCSTKVLFCFII